MSSSSSSSKLPACGFCVSAGKKGSLPISVEKRPKGKKVTVISNVTGSAKSLLSALSSLLGTGGTSRQEASGIHWTLEIQGDQEQRVAQALTQLGCLRGVKKDPAEKEKKTTEVVTRQCGYDKFLRDGKQSDYDLKSALQQEAYAPDCLPGAECFKWHGAWIYCRGRCQQTDLSDVWHENLRDDDEMAGDGDVPEAIRSLPELNLTLRDLGMLAEVGQAAKSWNLDDRANIGTGRTLDEYRKAARSHGSTLIGWEPASSSTSKTKTPSAPSRPAPSKSSSVVAPKLPKLGTFPCPICGSLFGLHKTLKLHIRNVHPGMPIPRPTKGLRIEAPVPAPTVSKIHGPPPGEFRISGAAFLNSSLPDKDGPRWAEPAGGRLQDKVKEASSKKDDFPTLDDVGSKGTKTTDAPTTAETSARKGRFRKQPQPAAAASASTLSPEAAPFDLPAMKITSAEFRPGPPGTWTTPPPAVQDFPAMTGFQGPPPGTWDNTNMLMPYQLGCGGCGCGACGGCEGAWMGSYEGQHLDPTVGYLAGMEMPGAMDLQMQQPERPWMSGGAQINENMSLDQVAWDIKSELQPRAEDSQADPSNAVEEVSKETSPCPVCNRLCPQDEIEEHVERCLEAHALDQASSESEDESHADEDDIGGAKDEEEENGIDPKTVYIVLESFEPEEGSNSQKAVSRGDKLVIVWTQPEEEGAYWAYGFQKDNPQEPGYVPLANLAPYTGQDPASSREAGEDECLPLDWLECFLALELSEERSEEFWEEFAEQSQGASGKSRETIWLNCISRAVDLAEADRKEAEEAEARGMEEARRAEARRAEEERREAAAKAARKADKKNRRVVVLTEEEFEMEQLRRKDEARKEARRQEEARKAEEARLAAEKQAAAGKKNKMNKQNKISADADAAGDSKEVSVEDVWKVVESWEPEAGQEDVQLEVLPGDCVLVEWRQPASEGGFWAYGRKNCLGEPGYVPLGNLQDPSKEPAPKPQTLQPPEPPKPKEVPEQTQEPPKPAKTPELPEPPKPPEPVSLGSESYEDSYEFDSYSRAPRLAPWRKQKQPGQETKTKSTVSVKQKAKKGVPKSDDFDESDDAKSAFGNIEQVQSWASDKMIILASRFCISSIDADVAWTALSMCSSNAEMRDYMKLLIADNAVVKNFADELWKRLYRVER